MSWLTISQACGHPCPWVGHANCVLARLSPEQIDGHHLGLGVFCGLRALYEMHAFQPCVHADGTLDWNLPLPAADGLVLAAATSDERPPELSPSPTPPATGRSRP